MASGKNNKQYGLILPTKGYTVRAPTRKNVFGDDSDSDSDGGGGGDWVKKSMKLEAQKSTLKRTTKNQMKKALAEDPTVFQYDEVYDDLEQKKEEATAAKKGVEKKPRYIQALLQTAEKRKKENERRIERQVQKEREEEGNQFADKESFVTSSYRDKLEEFKKQEEEEQRMERLEAIGDVTKQKDLTGFYRHLLRQTMGESLPGSSEANNPENTSTSDVKETQEDSAPSLKDGKATVKKDERKKDRHYRKRRSSSSDSSSDNDDKPKNQKEKNVDADSDFTGSASSSSESESGATGSGSEEGEIVKKKKSDPPKSGKPEKVEKKKRKIDKVDEKKKTFIETPSTIKEEPLSPKEAEEGKEINGGEKNNEEMVDNVKQESDSDSVSDKVEKEVKPKIDIWAKRTVGEAFDDAVQRYYERKAARTASGRA
ncbi:nuclear speckle splicing regulatory protein 1 [Frankliniella occidentalis]|uniref:Nuclear speckle splicing regulatory protein 1 n=1 Tax=Frankliniella occidentalis TaxID=133901 RepID=A0A6J1SPZ4_FRAOC|nr:nuclear speckle splicing regulatory protein 1 [Frankliniella occidentalis]